MDIVTQLEETILVKILLFKVAIKILENCMNFVQ